MLKMTVREYVFLIGLMLLAFTGLSQSSHIVRGLDFNIKEIEANHTDMITSVLDDPESTVWVASYNQLYRYNGAYFERYPLPFEFQRSSLALDRHGKIWMLYSKKDEDGRRVIILDPQTDTFIPLSEYAPGLASHSEELSKAIRIYDDAYGDIFFLARENASAHTSGFWTRWNGFNFDTLRHQAGGFFLYPNAPDQYTLMSYYRGKYYERPPDAAPSLIIKTNDNQAYRNRIAHIIGEPTPLWIVDTKTGIAHRGNAQAKLPNWHLVASSQKHSVWIAPDQSVHLLDTNFVSLGNCRFEEVQHLLGDKSYEYSNVGADRIWFYGINGTLSGIEVRSTPFQHIFTETQGYSSVRSFWTDDRNLHVALASAEFYIDHTIGKVHKDLKPQWDITATKILHSRDGQLWKCDEGIALSALNLKTRVWQRFSYLDTAQTRDLSHAWALHEDKNGKIWVGHRGGLSVTHGEKLRYIAPSPTFDSLKNTTVYHILETDTAFWLSTDGGIYQCSLQGEVQAWYHSEHGLPKSIIYHTELDAEGRFWLSTETAGLLCWSPTKGILANYTEANGFHSNTVYASLLDGYGYLWSSTANGLHRLNIQTGEVQFFLEEQGITHYEFNRNAYFRSKSGKLYFGGLNGITAFDPQDFLSTKTDLAPPTFVESFVKTDYDGGWKYIDAKEGQLEIPSTALEFKLIIGYQPAVLKGKKEFQYKIEGLQSVWKAIEGYELTHRPLPFGLHNLLVRTKNLDGNWTEPLSVKILSLKPIYLQTWFLVSLFLLVAGSLYATYRWRLQQYAQREALLESEVARRTQQIQLQSQELKELNETQSRFFANISHEVRTPLTLLYSPLKEMVGNIAAYSQQQLENRVQSMLSNSKLLLRLIDEILEISRLEKGQLEKIMEPCPAANYFADIAFRFNEEATLRQINFHFSNKLDKDVFLSLDSSKTDKVISNLLGNAFKYTATGGDITFEVKREGKLLNISVRDSGEGIPKKDLPYIFERFYQVDRSKKTKGWGIGLSFAKDITTLLGGDIHVESEVGKGSLFTLTVPYLEVANNNIAINSLAISTEEVYKPQGEKILIVEDNTEMRAFIRELLQDGFFIVEAENGMVAWQFLQQAHTDVALVISDVMMPELDGFALLERVRSSQGLLAVPFLFLTALSSNKSRIKGYATGVDDYMTKPFSPQELRVRVASLLQRFKVRKEAHAIDKDNNELAAGEYEEFNANDWEWLSKLEALMKENVGNSQVSMEYFADEMNVSYRHFNRKIKQLTGLTPLQYQRELKLQTTKELVEAGKYSLNQIADKVGFSRSNYLAKLYFERYGKRVSEN